jgi:RNA polymerase sigma factor (sigma-70 family)
MQTTDIKARLEEHHSDCFGWALHCCNGDIEKTRDVLQESYLKILERQHAFHGKAGFKTWAFRIIKNTSIDAHRKRMKDIMAVSTGHDLTGVLCDEEFEKRFERRLSQAYFSKGLEQLSLRQQQTLQLVFYHDLSLNQTAIVLNISEGSVRKHYDRAKKALAEWFRKKGLTPLNV